MARKPDEEITKALSHLHEQRTNTPHMVKATDAQIEKLKWSKQHAELTIKEISSYPANTKAYESVGRMFLLDNINNIKAGLNERMKNADATVKIFENVKMIMQLNLIECKDNIRDMLQQKQKKKKSG